MGFEKGLKYHGLFWRLYYNFFYWMPSGFTFEFFLPKCPPSHEIPKRVHEITK
jgi:hypothetical protein